MASDHIKRLCLELDLEVPKKEKDKSYTIGFKDDVEIKLWELNPGFYFHSNLIMCPTKNKEDLFIYLMRANLIGIGTGRARIGIDAEEKFLTLSDDMSYEIKYNEFKEKLENFVNFVTYWKKEIERFNQLAEKTIL